MHKEMAKPLLTMFEVCLRQHVGDKTYYAYESVNLYDYRTADSEVIEKVKRAIYTRCEMKLAIIIREAMEKEIIK